MQKRQPLEFNQYFHNIDESLHYQQEDTSSNNQLDNRNSQLNSLFKVKNSTSLTINNISQTYSVQEDITQSQNRAGMKYKCYKCFGVNKQLDLRQGRMRDSEVQSCSECNGTEYVTSDNGMAVLLESLIQSKYPQLFAKKKDKSGILKASLSESIYQSQNLNDSVEPKESGRIIALYGPKPAMKKISQQMQPLEISNNLQQPQQLKCDNCFELIEQFYESCLTCQKQSLRYIICDNCSSKKLFIHNEDHELAMKTLPNQYNKIFDNRSQIFSNIDLESSTNMQERKDQPFKYGLKVDSKQSLVGVFFDDESSSYQRSSDMSLSNNNVKDFNFIDLFPKIESTQIQVQGSERSERNSQVTPYNPQDEPSGISNVDFQYITPKKSISPIKRQQNTKSSTQVSISPKRCNDSSFTQYFKPNDNLFNDFKPHQKDMKFSIVNIQLQNSTQYDIKDKLEQGTALRTSPPVLRSNFDNYFQNSVHLRNQVSNKDQIQNQESNQQDYEDLTKAVYVKSFKSIDGLSFMKQQKDQEFFVGISPIIQADLKYTFSPNIHSQSSPPSLNILSGIETSIIKSTISDNIAQQFIFDCFCDICGDDNPIKNKRYHCQSCQDYDLCESCYNFNRSQHMHEDFQEINGLEIMRAQRKSKIQQLQKQMQNRKSIQRESIRKSLLSSQIK